MCISEIFCKNQFSELLIHNFCHFTLAYPATRELSTDIRIFLAGYVKNIDVQPDEVSRDD